MKRNCFWQYAFVAFFWMVACGNQDGQGDLCGNNTVDPGEECDGENAMGITCQDLGLGTGTLTCNADCTWDLSGCENAVLCGDGVVTGPYEICEETDLQGESCESLGYYGGTLRCAEDCRSFDESGCIGRCGDGTVQSSHGEDCDGTNLDGETCAGLGYSGGTLGCRDNCRFDTSECTGITDFCGDGQIQAGEDCDGTNLNGQTCVGLGYSQGSGNLLCTAACRFDESQCVPKSANANLASLTVSAGTLTPSFSAGTTSYAVRVPPSAESVTVAATAADQWATVSVTPPQPMAVSDGENPVTVTVTAESGAQKTYSVMVSRLDYLSPNIGMLLYVPGGTFQRDETTANRSVVSEFRMSQMEITRAQWTAVTGWPDPSDVSKSTSSNDPVQRVNWYHAITFCNRLSLLEGLTPVYTIWEVDFATLTYGDVPATNNTDWNGVAVNWSANGYRLPTEMEWMWAAMGADTVNPGAVNTTGYAKAFAGSDGSNAIGDYVWYFTNSDGKTKPVGTKLVNELGFHDLSGNVWEWVWDWHGNYPGGTLTDYRGPSFASDRIARGGGWSNYSSSCTLAIRTPSEPHSTYNGVGFRVVRR